MSEERTYGFNVMGVWVKGQISSILSTLAGKLDATATAINSSKLEGATKTQVVEEARLGLATIDMMASKLGTGDTAANSHKLEGSSKEQVIAEAIEAANLGNIASSDVFLSTVDPTTTDGKDGDFWITYVP